MKKNVIKVAIVGRPNVGKSLLFNRMCKRRLSIVDEMEGVTRDRLYSETTYFGTTFQLIDTAGIDPHSKGDYNRDIIEQSQMAIEEADAVILVVDGMVGVQPLDTIVNQLIRKANKPHLLAINKCEGQKNLLTYEFHSLGIEDTIEVSAMHGSGIEQIFDHLIELVDTHMEEEEDEGIRIAIVGRANVGKSTFLNQIVGEQRAVVSEIAGTTRDSIDVAVEVNDQRFTLIDTAGIRRRHKEAEAVEKFAAIRTQKAIKRADVCLMMIDAEDNLTTQEKKILSDIEKEKKGCILFINKWDKVKDQRMEHVKKDLMIRVPFLQYCPLVIGSALEGRNVLDVFKIATHVASQMKRRLTTSELNTFLERAMQLNHPPMIQGKRLRVYYMTQVEAQPPQFVLFVNYKDRMTPTYQKYLLNEFRKKYTFKGVPLNFYLKKRSQKELPHLKQS